LIHKKKNNQLNFEKQSHKIILYINKQKINTFNSRINQLIFLFEKPYRSYNQLNFQNRECGFLKFQQEKSNQLYLKMNQFNFPAS